MAKEKETPTGEKEQQGRGGGRQGLHCGEANPNQKLGGTSGRTSRYCLLTDQRSLYKKVPDPFLDKGWPQTKIGL